MGLPQHFVKLGSVAVNELGAKLNGKGRLGIAVRTDSAADALTRFEDDDTDTLFVQGSRRCQARNAGADDDNVEFPRRHISAGLGTNGAGPPLIQVDPTRDGLWRGLG